MSLTPLSALSPVDGRYASRCDELRELFSESGLIRARVRVEIAWLQALAATLRPAGAARPDRRGPGRAEQGGRRTSAPTTRREVKAIERETNHDVKAVEYFIKRRLEAQPGWRPRLEFVHFACTSEDINNLAYASDVPRRAPARAVAAARGTRRRAAGDGACACGRRDDVAHARPAGDADDARQGSRRIFVHRLRQPATRSRRCAIRGKINGAVGNFNAHVAAYPDAELARARPALRRVARPRLEPVHDADRAARLDGRVLRRARALQHRAARPEPRLLGLHLARLFPPEGRSRAKSAPRRCRTRSIRSTSRMPRATSASSNALLRFISDKLPISRWQRDLTDSTVLRNIGVALATR